MAATQPHYGAPARFFHWAIAVLIVLGLLVAVDRISVALAESAVATTLQNSQHLPSKPSVDIDGFPFLTQLASGNYSKIELGDDE